MATSSIANSPSSSLIMSLGGGSGVDIRALAQNLVDAEKQPKAELIQKSIDKQQKRLVGYDVVSRAVAQIKDALDTLAQPATFSSFTSSSSQPAAVNISGSSTAVTGQHEVVVQQLAKGQRSIAVGAPSPFQSGVPAGAGKASVFITMGDPNAVPLNLQTLQVSADDTKPESIVNAINAKGWPITASLVNMTGVQSGEVRIVLNGATGNESQFTASITDGNGLGSSIANFSVSQTAQNSRVTVNGVADIERSSNSIEGVIQGAVLKIASQTAGVVTVGLARDSTVAKEKIKQLVSTYNDLQAIIDAAQDPNSAVEKLGGSLVGDTTIRGLRDQIRSILLPTRGSSFGSQTVGGVTTPVEASGSQRLQGLRDLGVMIDTDGKMKFSSIKEFDPLRPQAPLLKIDDESTLDLKLSGSFEEVVALFQGGSGKPGIASDMADLISGSGRYTDTSFTPSSPTKLIMATQRNARGFVDSDKNRLAALEDRMSALLDRYIKQFAIMDSLVGQSKAEKSGVENSFKAMSASR